MADLATAGNLPTNADITSFLHIQDAATAAASSLTWPSGPVNIVDNEPAPATTWLPVFAQAVGAPTPPSPTSTSRTPWARGATNTHAHTLGWSPTHPTWRTGFLS
ncbi:hypothetical protein ACFWUU_22025 [Kribbella sp. NPDC058693]|uniref:hypothetical protein n=1 Tax=Kribbella sp. NPDC058693 TaxID=3346602 RepID=UPI00366970C6